MKLSLKEMQGFLFINECNAIVSRSGYIIVQPSFTSFSPKVFRLTDLDINSK